MKTLISAILLIIFITILANQHDTRINPNAHNNDIADRSITGSSSLQKHSEIDARRTLSVPNHLQSEKRNDCRMGTTAQTTVRGNQQSEKKIHRKHSWSARSNCNARVRKRSASDYTTIPGVKTAELRERISSNVQGKRCSHRRTEKRITNTALEPTSISYTTISRFIQASEGFRAKPYKCAAGKLTVGFGKVISGHKNAHRTVYETVRSAREDLKRRIQADYDQLIKYTSRDTALVLCSFAYNCGISRAKALIRSHRTRDLGRYVYAKGRFLSGLAKRRKTELALLEKAR